MCRHFSGNPIQLVSFNSKVTFVTKPLILVLYFRTKIKYYEGNTINYCTYFLGYNYSWISIMQRTKRWQSKIRKH